MHNLIRRNTPSIFTAFVLETIEKENGKSVYTVSGRNGKVVLGGDCKISQAMAYYRYLKDYCGVSVSHCGNTSIPDITEAPVPEKEIKHVIEEINLCQGFIISADINSGINGDTGAAPIAVNSDLTVSIGYLKTGMFLNDAPYYIDKLRNADIGITLLREEYKLVDYEMLHMFEGYNSISMTIEEFYERFGYTPEDGGIAEKAAQLSAEQGKTVVIKTEHSAVIGDIKYVYFCADYII